MSNLLNTLEMILEEKDKKVEGTYVGAKFSKKTIKELKNLMKEVKVPKPLASDKFHTTIIFSRTKFPDDFEALGKLDKPWIGIPKSFDIFTGRNKQNCLVLKYECKDQVDRHKLLMKEYNATYDWPEFKVHLTMSYDCGDFDFKSIKIEDYIKDIEIIEEYTEPLQLEWLANKDKKESDE